MATYSQTKRPMKVETTLGNDALLLTGFSGEEGVSLPFGYTLDLLSENPEVSAEDLLRSPAVVTLLLSDGEERYIHGLIRRFVQLGQVEDLTSYRAEVVPWPWFLSLSSESKIFQNKSVLEIVEDVFKSQGFSDFDIKCTKSYATREYCVQYRETHLNFVSRLLEEEGIFYFFEHTASKHTLVLADGTSAVKPCPGQSTVRMAAQAGEWQEEDVVTMLQREHAVHTGKVTLRDYDYLQPSLRLESMVSSDSKPAERYTYPGSFTTLDDGERLARLQLEALEAWEQVVRGESTSRSFQSGCKFDLKEHYRADANQAYQLLRVQHSARAGDYRSWDTAPLDYHNVFVAIPHSVPFRPPPTAAKPVVQGSQTALVVGPSGEEIWTDKHGRVKVQFYWDREGKKDENSSCWVRVASTWAGKNWGVIQIPRIGQEVIVDFLEGDPDRPIITGRVYNADQTPPYALPANQTQAGIKTRSSKGGSGENFNEIRMEDKKGSEQLYIHAEKDKQVVVENDRTESVGHDESITIGNDRTESVGKNESITIGDNRTEKVGKDETVSIGKNRSLTVGDNEKVKIGKDLSTDVGDSLSTTVGKDSAISVGKNHGLTVKKKITIKAGDSISIESDKEIVLKTGKATLQMKKNGDIVLKGGKISVKGSKDVIVKGSKIAQN